MLRELAWIVAIMIVVVSVTLIWHQSRSSPLHQPHADVSRPNWAELRRSIPPTGYP